MPANVIPMIVSTGELDTYLKSVGDELNNVNPQPIMELEFESRTKKIVIEYTSNGWQFKDINLYPKVPNRTSIASQLVSNLGNDPNLYSALVVSLNPISSNVQADQRTTILNSQLKTLPELKAMIQRKPAPDLIDILARNKNAELIRDIQKNGEKARVNATTFSWAAKNLHIDVVRALLLHEVVDLDNMNWGEILSSVSNKEGGIELIKVIAENKKQIYFSYDDFKKVLGSRHRADFVEELINTASDLQLNQSSSLDSKGDKIKAKPGVYPDQYSLLHLAAMYNHACIKPLVKRMPGLINKKGFKGLTPAHIAAGYGNLDSIEVLVQLGADFSITEDDKKSPLHLAVERDIMWGSQIEVVKKLVKLKVPLTSVDNQGRTPLTIAMNKQSVDLDVIEELIASGAYSNIAELFESAKNAYHHDEYFKSDYQKIIGFIAMEAAKKGEISFYINQLQLIDICHPNNRSWYDPGEKRYVRQVENFNTSTLLNREGNTLAHVAAQHNQVEFIQALVHRGWTDLKRRNKQEKDVFDLALEINNPKMIAYLCNVAAASGYKDILGKFFTKAKNTGTFYVDSDIFDNAGQNVDVIKFLLDYEQVVNQLNKTNLIKLVPNFINDPELQRFLINFAAENGNVELLAELSRKGADLNASTGHDSPKVAPFSPAFIAALNGKMAVLEQLKDSGANLKLPVKCSIKTLSELALKHNIKNQMEEFIQHRLQLSGNIDKLNQDFHISVSPLDIARLMNQVEVCELLKSKLRPNTIPGTYPALTNDKEDALNQAVAILKDYTKASSSERFFKGNWNRHHIPEIERIIKESTSAEDLWLELNKIALVNEQGSLAKCIQFIGDNIMRKPEAESPQNKPGQ